MMRWEVIPSCSRRGISPILLLNPHHFPTPCPPPIPPQREEDPSLGFISESFHLLNTFVKWKELVYRHQRIWFTYFTNLWSQMPAPALPDTNKHTLLGGLLDPVHDRRRTVKLHSLNQRESDQNLVPEKKINVIFPPNHKSGTYSQTNNSKVSSKVTLCLALGGLELKLSWGCLEFLEGKDEV